MSEIGDTGYDIKYHNPSLDMHHLKQQATASYLGIPKSKPPLRHVSFKTDKGTPYNVKIHHSETEDGDKGVSLSFSNDNASDPYGVTGHGDSIKVFTTVKNVLADYLEQHPDSMYVTFTAHSSEQSRVKLYDMFAKQFQKWFPAYSNKIIRKEGNTYRYFISKEHFSEV